MFSYDQYCPVAHATEILGDRWTLLIVREMLGGASGFNELQRGLPGISRSVLTDRMRALERAGVIKRRTGPKGRTLDYRLTPGGRDLQPVVQAIGEWGATWSFTEPRSEELDPSLLIVWMARHVDRRRLPPDRTVVQFDFRDPKRRYWMVLEPSEISVCLQHPGFDVDLEVQVDTATLYRVYLGRAELGGAIAAGRLTMNGPRALQRGFGQWFTWSAFAPASRSAQERRTAASRLAGPDRVRVADDGDPGAPGPDASMTGEPTSGATVTVNGVGLYVEERGGGAPIVCIHGAGGTTLAWSGAIDRLSRLGRVIAYDRRGCARSERPARYERTSIAEHADDAAALIDALGAAPAIVVGRSYGATVATDLALRHPDRVRALVLLEGDASREQAPAAAEWVDRLTDRLLAVAAREGVDAVAKALITDVADERAWLAFPDEIRRLLESNGPAILAELQGEWWLDADAAALATIHQPALLVAAADSPPEFREPVEALAAALPDARTALVGGGHLIDPAAPEVLAFLEEVLGRPR